MTGKPKPPAISVVVATYNRSETLRRLLRCLSEQDLDGNSFELVLVSDASPDDTAGVVEELGPQLPFSLTYIENERNRGIGYSQNEGIRTARAPVVLLMADDILQTSPSLRTHLEFHRDHPEQTAAALGRVLQAPELDETVFLRNWDPFQFRRLAGATVLPRYRFWACNLSFKRDFMLRWGMFRQDMGRTGGHEDTEVGYRLARRGLRIHYLPEALAYHRHVYTLDQAVRRWYLRGQGYHRLQALVGDPELTVFLHVLNRRTVRQYVRVLRRPNALSGWEKSLAWHLLREAVRRVVLNAATVRLLWRPILNRAEKWPWLGRRMNTQIYRAYLYYHFLRGVRDGARGKPAP